MVCWLLILSAGLYSTQLSSYMSDIVVAVHARERKLKEQVQELRTQIDQAKRWRQVKEMVEDDFFWDLQARAKEVRGEHQDDLGTGGRA